MGYKNSVFQVDCVLSDGQDVRHLRKGGLADDLRDLTCGASTTYSPFIVKEDMVDSEIQNSPWDALSLILDI